MLTGVYLATKKDKTVYYRSNITHKGRHISLGSFPTEVQAHQAYTAACELLDVYKRQTCSRPASADTSITSVDCGRWKLVIRASITLN